MSRLIDHPGQAAVPGLWTHTGPQDLHHQLLPGCAGRSWDGITRGTALRGEGTSTQRRSLAEMVYEGQLMAAQIEMGAETIR